MIKTMKRRLLVVAVAAATAAGLATPVQAQNEQFVPLLSYRVGPFAAGGSGIFGGYIDYMNLVNMRDGGVNGVKLVWEECETEYNASRGVECYERLKKKGPTGASLVQPLSTGITYGLIDRVAVDKVPMVTLGYGRTDAADGRVFPYVFPMITTYWSQASAMVNYIGNKLGGMDKLKGKKIVHLYHDSAFGKEPIPVFEALAKQYGFELIAIPVPNPGNEQQSQWLQIRKENPDYVILWGWGVMNPTAIRSAARVGYPREKMIGVWWAGAEEDVIPAGDAAKGYTAAGFNAPGADYAVMKEIQKTVYGAGKGNMEDKSRFGSIYHTRGVVHGIITVEAIRKAQEKYGKGKPLTGEQIRWGLENLNLDEARLKALGATGLMPPTKITCADHEGSGLVKFQQWDGKQWKVVSDWVQPDRKLVRGVIEDSANKYAAEKKITPRDCSKEG
ncbi:MAG: ABC transporter substrate-binding protein [Betaproteobacteria bacterium]